jgi:hypothetical protein
VDDIVSEGGDGFVSGSGSVDRLLGETDGVVSNGVSVWLSPRNSKFERLDGGLVSDSDDATFAGNGKWLLAVVQSGSSSVVGSFLEKRPELSLDWP